MPRLIRGIERIYLKLSYNRTVLHGVPGVQRINDAIQLIAGRRLKEYLYLTVIVVVAYTDSQAAGIQPDVFRICKT